MADSALNQFVGAGTTAERTAFIPSPPTPASGPDQGYLWWDTDTQTEWAYDFGLADWVELIGGSGTVTNSGTLTADMVILGNGTTVVKALAAGTAGQVLAMNGGATAAVWATVAGTGDVVGPAASVDQEIALFDGTTGKLLERATGTGYVKVTSGVMGTPAAGVPIATDVSGLGTGVATALGINVGSAGAPVLFNGALGTPSSGTATNLTGLPLTTGVTGDLPFANLAQGAALSVLGVTGNATADVASIAAASDHQVFRRSGTAVAFGAVNLAQGAAVVGTLPSTNLPADVTTKVIGITIDGGGSTITTGIKADMYIPFTCEITEVTMLADQTGSIVVDIWADALANYPPDNADSITASAPPTITADTNSQDTTLTGWTTTITAGDTLRFNVDSATSIQRVNLTLTVTT